MNVEGYVELHVPTPGWWSIDGNGYGGPVFNKAASQPAPQIDPETGLPPMSDTEVMANYYKLFPRRAGTSAEADPVWTTSLARGIGDAFRGGTGWMKGMANQGPWHGAAAWAIPGAIAGLGSGMAYDSFLRDKGEDGKTGLMSVLGAALGAGIGGWSGYSRSNDPDPDGLHQKESHLKQASAKDELESRLQNDSSLSSFDKLQLMSKIRALSSREAQIILEQVSQVLIARLLGGGMLGTAFGGVAGYFGGGMLERGSRPVDAAGIARTF
jgi:hypothetical protein